MYRMRSTVQISSNVVRAPPHLHAAIHRAPRPTNAGGIRSEQIAPDKPASRARRSISVLLVVGVEVEECDTMARTSAGSILSFTRTRAPCPRSTMVRAPLRGSMKAGRIDVCRPSQRSSASSAIIRVARDTRARQEISLMSVEDHDGRTRARRRHDHDGHAMSVQAEADLDLGICSCTTMVSQLIRIPEECRTAPSSAARRTGADAQSTTKVLCSAD